MRQLNVFKGFFFFFLTQRLGQETVLHSTHRFKLRPTPMWYLSNTAFASVRLVLCSDAAKLSLNQRTFYASVLRHVQTWMFPPPIISEIPNPYVSGLLYKLFTHPHMSLCWADNLFFGLYKHALEFQPTIRDVFHLKMKTDVYLKCASEVLQW